MPHRSESILVVEDNADEIFFMQMAFAELGYGERVHYARDGTEAVTYILGIGPYADRSKYPFPCLIVTDLKMPMMSGLELLKWVREESRCKTIPVFVFTSSKSPKDCEEAKQLGATAYFQKPFPGDSLIPVLKRMETNWPAQLALATGKTPTDTRQTGKVFNRTRTHKKGK